MSRSLLRIGLAGYGHISEHVHAPILRKIPGARIAALAEPDEARRRAAAAAHGRGVRVFSDYREMIQGDQVDAVVLCLPSGLHADAALAVVLADKHLYLEKPLATTVEDGRRVCRAWSQSRRTAMMGFNYRGHPLIRRLQDLLKENRLGPVQQVRTVFHSRPGDPPAWKRRRDQGGGVLLDLASHHFDLLYFLFASPVRELRGQLRSVNGEDDTARVEARLDNGITVQSSFSLAAADEDSWEIQGARHSLVLDRHRGLTLRSPSEAARPPAGKRAWLFITDGYARAKMLAPGYEPSYKEALSRFVAAARAGRRIPPTLDDGYRSLCVVAAAEESARTGRTTIVNYDTGLAPAADDHHL